MADKGSKRTKTSRQCNNRPIICNMIYFPETEIASRTLISHEHPWDLAIMMGQLCVIYLKTTNGAKTDCQAL